MKETDLQGESRVNGIPASPGIEIGKAYLVDNQSLNFSVRSIGKEEVESEYKKLTDAIANVEKDIDKTVSLVENRVASNITDIFRAYKLMVNDPILLDGVRKTLVEELMSIEYAFSKAIGEMISRLNGADDEYLRARTHDVYELSHKIMTELLGQSNKMLQAQGKNLIYVSNDIHPGELAHLDKTKFAGLALNMGSKTSHSAILARAFDIPAVVGTVHATRIAHTGDIVILDATSGELIVKPTQKTLNQYKLKRKKYLAAKKQLLSAAARGSVTQEGAYYRISANIELPEEADAANFYQTEGVGLFRTEFFYLDRKTFPSEDEQYESYKYVADKMFPAEVIIRTMDIGGDKFLEYLNLETEKNPFLGFRAIRFSLKNPEIFKTQLRAIIRANERGNVKLLIPMITNLEEIEQTKKYFHQCIKELEAEGHKVKRPEFGVMIEVPSAAILADDMAKEVDFFSIGTNDLIQYSLAVERGNEFVAHLYSPFNPSILRLIKNVVDAAHDNGIWVGVCGAIAGNPFFAIPLVGLGVDELSMTCYDIPLIKLIIRAISKKDAQTTVDKMIKCHKAADIQKIAEAELKKVLGKKYVDLGIKK